MTRFLGFLLLTAMAALGMESGSPPSVATFNRDVLPVLQKNCQVCHRPGGVAPMSFMTYESARPWAKAIKAAVINQKMPPWFADPRFGEFRNAPKLVQRDIQTLAAWADSGAPEGGAADRPADVKWADGWRIQPDVIVSMPQPYAVAAKGAGEIRQFFIENPFKEDTWVSAIEIRPGDASVVHHVIVQIPEKGPGGQPNAPARTLCGICPDDAQKQIFQAAFADAVTRNGVGAIPQGSYSDILARQQERQTGRGIFMTMEAVYAPGSPPLDFRYGDSAKLIQGGKAIRIEVHYTPNGKETTDQTQIAFTLAKAPAQRRFVMMAPEHLVDIRKPIPAGEANWETKGELTFNQDAELVWFMPHMHLRGKDMTYLLIYPDGREQTVLNTKYNFNWQLGYEVENPIQVTKGTRMIVTAHHDNSANNPMNPTPGQLVPWGELTSQEMMLPWFGVVVDGAAEPERIATYKPGDLDGPFPMPPAMSNFTLRVNRIEVGPGEP